MNSDIKDLDTKYLRTLGPVEVLTLKTSLTTASPGCARAEHKPYALRSEPQSGDAV